MNNIEPANRGGCIRLEQEPEQKSPENAEEEKDGPVSVSRLNFDIAMLEVQRTVVRYARAETRNEQAVIGHQLILEFNEALAIGQYDLLRPAAQHGNRSQPRQTLSGAPCAPFQLPWPTAWNPPWQCPTRALWPMPSRWCSPAAMSGAPSVALSQVT